MQVVHTRRSWLLLWKTFTTKANTEPRKQNDIQWNFTKFLVNRNGEVVARFEPTVDLKEVQKAVEAEL